MREIKFRGINNDGNWCFGDLIQSNNDHNVWIHAPNINHTYKVAPATVGQFTGIKDITGEDIYEGDIIEATLNDKSLTKRFYMDETIVGKISFEGAWRLGEQKEIWHLLRYYTLKVIGNVYDNPGLLEVDHD